MLSLAPQVKIFLAIKPLDFRTRLSGTLALCRNQLQVDPNCGHVFVFRNKKTTTVRLLVFDQGGFWLSEKRLSCGRFHFWPTSRYDCCELTPAQLHLLLANGP